MNIKLLTFSILTAATFSVQAQWSGTNPLLTNSNVGIGTNPSTGNASLIIDRLQIGNLVGTNPFLNNWGTGIGFMCGNNGNAAQYSARLTANNYNFMQNSDLNFFTRSSNLIVQRMTLASDGLLSVGNTPATGNENMVIR